MSAIKTNSGASKRANSDLNADDKEGQPGLHDELESILGDLGTSLSASISASIGVQVVSAVNESVTSALTRMQARNEARFSENERRMDEHDATLLQQAEAIKSLQGGLAQAEKDTPDRSNFVSADWERLPDPAVLVAGTNSLVAKTDIERVLRTWLADYCKPEHVTFKGPPLGNRFRIVFEGKAGLGARRASQCFDTLRTNDGWQRFKTNLPSAQVDTVDIFINPDRNPKQNAEGATIRRIIKTSKSIYPDKKFTPIWKGAAVACDFVPFVRVLCNSKESTELKRNPTAITTLQLDKPAMEKAFKDDAAKGVAKQNLDDIAWV